MPITNSAIELITDALSGLTIVPFDPTHSFIGVGDSTISFDANQTDLQATSNKFRKFMDPSFPVYDGVSAFTFQSTFDAGQASFAWEEWAVFNASTAGIMFNRQLLSLGTKSDFETWTFTVVVNLTAGI